MSSRHTRTAQSRGRLNSTSASLALGLGAGSPSTTCRDASGVLAESMPSAMENAAALTADPRLPALSMATTRTRHPPGAAGPVTVQSQAPVFGTLAAMSSHGPKRPDRDKKRSADGAS